MTIPSWLTGSLRPFSYSSVYCCHNFWGPWHCHKGNLLYQLGLSLQRETNFHPEWVHSESGLLWYCLYSADLTQAKLWKLQTVSWVSFLSTLFSVICSMGSRLFILSSHPHPSSSLAGQGLCASNIFYPDSLVLNPSKLTDHASFIQLQRTFFFPTSWDRNDSLIWRYKPPIAGYSFMYDLKLGQGITQTWIRIWVLLLSRCSEHEAFVVSASLFVKWWYEHQFYRIIKRIK